MAARTSVILQAETNRAPAVAQAALGVLALACVAGTAIGLSRSDAKMARAEAALLNSMAPRSPAPARPSTGSTPPPAPPLPYPPAPTYSPGPAPTMLVPSPASAPPYPGNPALRAPLTPSAPGPSTPAPMKTSKPSIPLDKQLKNPEAMEAVMAARVLRDKQDMLNAIKSLQSADVREPDHPEIVGEMALTYEAMGLATKAENCWRRVYLMGEDGAGDYFMLAAERVGSQGGATAPASAAESSPVSLGACRLSREPLAKQGEKITLRVPVLAAQGATIDPTRMEIRVSYYESVNKGERIEAVPTGKTTQLWSSEPTNWADPSGETVDVVYDLFALRPNTAGTRSFHGYAVKLYYQDKLVGEQAQPEELRNGAKQGAKPAGLDNALFPK